jgi:hypothetical protein
MSEKAHRNAKTEDKKPVLARMHKIIRRVWQNWIQMENRTHLKLATAKKKKNAVGEGSLYILCGRGQATTSIKF